MQTTFTVVNFALSCVFVFQVFLRRLCWPILQTGINRQYCRLGICWCFLWVWQIHYQKQIQITIWWWDEQACLGIKDSDEDDNTLADLFSAQQLQQLTQREPPYAQSKSPIWYCYCFCYFLLFHPYCLSLIIVYIGSWPRENLPMLRAKVQFGILWFVIVIATVFVIFFYFHPYC